MRIRVSISDELWWGVFHDANRSCLYIAPVPRLLVLIAWGPQYDHGHMTTSGLIARRDRLTDEVETLLLEREDAWRPVHPLNVHNFRPGSPAATGKQP